MGKLLQLLPILVLTAFYAHAQGESKNGFNLTDALVPVSEIQSGGPPRDGIPAIDRPRFVQPEAAGFVQPGDRVLGIARNGVAKAYPVAILNWHEIVNDTFADEPIAVTYCPLCGTGIAYVAGNGGQVMRFGVSGLLYNSDMLLYDRQTESLWSQIGKHAISGLMKGTRLQAIPLQHTTWADWRERYPGTLVLSTDTGHARDYSRSPYSGYEKSSDVFFPVRNHDTRYHPKESVLGVEIDGRFKAYPFVELEKSDGQVRDRLGGRTVTVTYDRRHRTAGAVDDDGNPLPVMVAYWFAWYAFHPDTAVYHAP